MYHKHFIKSISKQTYPAHRKGMTGSSLLALLVVVYKTLAGSWWENTTPCHSHSNIGEELYVLPADVKQIVGVVVTLLSSKRARNYY